VPSLNDPLVPKLLASFAKQLGKRNPNRRVPWERAVSEAEQHKRLCEELGVEGSGGVWQRKTEGLGHLAKAVSRELVRLCRLRGLAEIPEDLAAQSARLAVHNSRAFGWNSPRFQVLTVHAAKNREFDHVFVFWTFKAEKWSDEEQRRLLYNAVTRAKLDCTVLVLGNEKSTCEDPVIGLLGPAQPAFDPAWKKGKPKAAGRT
jgi:DNA helicase IV